MAPYHDSISLLNSSDEYVTKDQLKFYVRCRDKNYLSSISGESADISKGTLNISMGTHSTYHINLTIKNYLNGKMRTELAKVLLNTPVADYYIEQLTSADTNHVQPDDFQDPVIMRKIRMEAVDQKIGYSEFKGRSMPEKSL